MAAVMAAEAAAAAPQSGSSTAVGTKVSQKDKPTAPPTTTGSSAFDVCLRAAAAADADPAKVIRYAEVIRRAICQWRAPGRRDIGHFGPILWFATSQSGLVQPVGYISTAAFAWKEPN